MRKWLATVWVGAIACAAHGQCGPAWTDVLGLAGFDQVRQALEYDPDGPGPAAPGTVFVGDFDRPAQLFSARHVAFFHDGRWSGLGAGFEDDAVLGGVVWNGRLVVFGPFMRSGGQVVQDLAWWDGTNWLPVSTGIERRSIGGLAVYHGELIAHGSFTSIGGVSAPGGVARFDGTSWHSMASGISGYARCTAEFEGELVVGGPLTAIDGVQVSGFAKWNGSRWAPVGAGGPIGAQALAVHRGELFAGGSFQTVASHVARWNGASWQQVGAGLHGNVSSVTTLLSLPEGLLAGGSFTDGGGEPLQNVALWDGAAWRRYGGVFDQVGRLDQTPMGLLAFGPRGSSVSGLRGVGVYRQQGHSGPGWYPLGEGLSAGASACAPYLGGLVVAGAFDYAGGMATDGLAMWRGGKWNYVGDPNAGLVRRPIFDLAVYHNDLYVATNELVARTQGAAWQRISGGTRGTFYGFLEHEGQLVVYGDFSRIGTADIENIARYDGSTWSAFGATLRGGDIYTACVFNGKIVVGGTMERASGLVVRGAAVWDGAAWKPLGNGLSAAAGSLAPFDGRLFAVGNFSLTGFPGRRYFAQWNGMRWEPATPAEEFDRAPWMIRPYRDGLLISGDFTRVGGQNFPGVCVWDGRQFLPFADGSEFVVYDHCVVDGKDWFVGGALEVGGRTVRHVAALNDTGPYVVEPERLSVTCPGGSVDLHCIPADAGLGYAWARNGQPLADGPTPWGSIVSGSATAVVSISNAGILDAGEYVCEVSAPCGVSSSLPAHVGVCKTDRNCDGALDFFDFTRYVEEFGTATGAADFNEDGFVDFFDFNDFMIAFDAGC